jgi:galactokinase
MLTATKARLDEREFADAVQAVAEMRWVASAEGTLREGDHRQLGQYLSLCHESAREHRRMVSGEGHVLVEIASGHKACLGARALTGANRSGIVSLVNYHEVEGFVAHLMDGAKTKLGRAVAPLVCSVVEGAG